MRFFLSRIALSSMVGLLGVQQSFGQFQTGGNIGFGGTTTGTTTGMTQGFGTTQGFGGTQGLGGTQAVGGAASTGGTFSPTVGPFGGLGVSGAFGGRGVTGAARQEFSTLNAAEGVVVPNASGGLQQGGAAGATQVGAANQAFGQGGQFGGGLGGGGLGTGLNAFSRAGGLGGIGGLGGLGGGGARNSSSQAKSKIRTVVKPDIEVDRDTSAEAAAVAQARIGRIPIPKRISNVAYTVENGTVVIRGEVSSETDKKLAERLVLLEPGVNSVRNEVSVRNKAPERIPATPIR